MNLKRQHRNMKNIWILKIRNCLFFMMRVREQELSAVESVCLTEIQIGNGGMTYGNKKD